ncbi:MAG: DUF2259 domain-containing protein [Phyllobacterium sp.]
MHRGSLRNIILALAAFCSGSLPALAGDAARLDILGFTADGKTFAFEEYGVQDGSGFPYANRFYISTETDSFLAKTPIRIMLKDEQVDTGAARTNARIQAETATGIPDSILRTHAGETVASNPVTELSADPFRVKVNPRSVFPPIDEPIEFMLEDIPVPQPDNCKGLGEAKGFRLTMKDAKSGGEPRLLHEDKSAPASRGCPLGYRIGAVQMAFPSSGTPVFAVMVSVRRFGFEGPDHRWLAVTGRQ